MPALFPEKFAWGTATAAYQIEGGWAADGKGSSIWDDFTHQVDRIKTTYMWDPATGDVACDHYHRWEEDVALMRGLGVNAYRLSLSWARLLPEGTGRVNPAGVAFYRRLLGALREAGVAPWVTLYHWDLPSELYRKGGWLNRDSADWFAAYAAVVVRELGDLVEDWITFNEPQVFVGCGLGDGVHAPGLRLSLSDLLMAGHNVLRAHGQGVRALRAGASRACRVGIAPVGMIKTPATESAADIAAARQMNFTVWGDNLWNNGWWYDPAIFGRYPEDGLARFGRWMPTGWERDMDGLAPALDFLGTNIYMGEPVAAGPDGRPVVKTFAPGTDTTAFKWTVTPTSLRWGPRFLHERYQLPIVITENGVSNVDWVQVDGTVPDPQRVDFLRRYLRELARAIAEGTEVRGYFHWSLMDNFEWAEGYRERFGLIHVDFGTLKRTPKQSYSFYRDIIRTRGACLW